MRKPTITENYYFPNIKTWIAILNQNCINCQTSEFMSNLIMAPQQPFLEVSQYFNRCISMKPKAQFLVLKWKFLRLCYSRCIHTLCDPSSFSQKPWSKCITYIFDNRTVKFGIPNSLVTDDGNPYINGEFAHFCRMYNVQFKPRTILTTYGVGGLNCTLYIRQKMCKFAVKTCISVIRY